MASRGTKENPPAIGCGARTFRKPRKVRQPQSWRCQHKSKVGQPPDVSENHIHLEQLNPQTGEVIQNLHLRWPEGTGR